MMLLRCLQKVLLVRSPAEPVDRYEPLEVYEVPPWRLDSLAWRVLCSFTKLGYAVAISFWELVFSMMELRHIFNYEDNSVF